MQRTIPNYRLYAGDGEALLDQWVHCETIASRSARHRWHIRPHAHAEFFQVLHVRAGDVTAEIDDRTSRPAVPCLVLLPPAIPHGFRFSRSIEGHILTISAGRLDRLLSACGGAQALVAEPRVVCLGASGADARAVAELVTAIAAEFAMTGRWQSQRIEALTTALLIAAIRQVVDDAGGGSGCRPSMDPRALAFRAAVDRRFRSHCPLRTYARDLAVSETHLNRICRRAFGMSALAFIQRRIVLEASRDLTFTTHSVAAIARSLGYDDPAYFTRIFRKQTGLSPRAFRAAA